MTSNQLEESREFMWINIRMINPNLERSTFDAEWDSCVAVAKIKEKQDRKITMLMAAVIVITGAPLFAAMMWFGF